MGLHPSCIHLASILHPSASTFDDMTIVFFLDKCASYIKYSKYIKLQLFAFLCLILFYIFWSFRGWWAGEGGRCLEKEGARDETRFFHQRRRQLLLGRSQHSDLAPLCSTMFHLDSVKIAESVGRSENILHQKSVGDFAKDCGTPMNKIHPVTAHQFNEIFERVYFGPGRVLCGGFVTHDIRHRSSSIALVYWNTCWWSTLKSDCFLHVRLCPVSVVYFFQAQKPRDCCMYRVALCFVAQVLIASHGLVFWATTIMEDCGFNMAQQPQQLQFAEHRASYRFRTVWELQEVPDKD